MWEHVEIVRRMAEVWNQGGWNGVAEQGLLHRKSSITTTGNGRRHGPPSGHRHSWNASWRSWTLLGKDAKVEVEELIDAGGDSVVMIFRFTGEARASGIRHDYRWGYVSPR